MYTYEDGAVYRKDVSIQWQNGDVALISSGVANGDQLVVSPLGQIASGTPVKVLGEAPKQPAADKELSLKEWIDELPPQRLDRLKQKAERDGKSLEAVAEEMRAKHQGKRPAPQGEKP